MMTPIAAAVEPLRSAAMDRAEQFARSYAARLVAELEAAGWDAEISAPYPNSTRMSRPDYIAAKVHYEMVRRFTKGTSTYCRRPNDPDVREVNPEAIERFALEARREADAQYSAFIAKLEAKIGEHTSADLWGNHVWDYSILTVETPQGRQNWKTQQIVNVSKLGKVFNQWPTRQTN